MQVRQLDRIVIVHGDLTCASDRLSVGALCRHRGHWRTDTSRNKVHEHRTAEPACSDDEDVRLLEPELTCVYDRHQQSTSFVAVEEQTHLVVQSLAGSSASRISRTPACSATCHQPRPWWPHSSRAPRCPAVLPRRVWPCPASRAPPAAALPSLKRPGSPLQQLFVSSWDPQLDR